MDYDLLIRGGMVVDGSGLPGVRADVGVKAGKIVAIGRLRGSAAQTLNVEGLVVAPGFIDHHTHLDAQVFWDPYGTSEPENGVTTVVMGNCGLTLAPVKKGDENALVLSFARVEAMPRVVLEKGIPWGWHTYGDYLDALEGKVGINVGGLVGHIALRHYVLGEEAVERGATPEETARMQQALREALEGGALGLSTNRREQHFRDDGKPVASRLADDVEFFALCDVLTDLDTGVIETILGSDPKSRYADIQWYDRLARRTERPIIWQAVQHRWIAPDLWREQLDALTPIFRDGYRAYALTNDQEIRRSFNLKTTQTFDEFPTWKNVMFLPEEARKQALRDPDTRAKLKADMADPKPTAFSRRWDLIPIVQVSKPEHQHYVGKSVAEMAALRGQDPVDAFLDLSLEEELETRFENAGGDLEVMAQILRSPYVLVGVSDAGAHVQSTANFAYGTTLLARWVRDRGVLSLEEAVRKLTFQVASVYGLEGRGLLRPGYAADITVFDPQSVNPGEPEWSDDYPFGARRLVQHSEGMHYTIVNGHVIYQDGRLQGDLPGQVLRGAAYRASHAIPA